MHRIAYFACLLAISHIRVGKFVFKLWLFIEKPQNLLQLALDALQAFEGVTIRTGVDSGFHSFRGRCWSGSGI